MEGRYFIMMPTTTDYIINEMKINRVSKRKVYLNTQVDDDSIFIIREQILKIVESDKINQVKKDKLEPINIYISSDGGSCVTGLSLISLCNRLKKEDYIIKTIVTANSYSMGSIIACACASKGQRYCEENAQYLIHQPRVYKYEQVATAEDIRRESEQIKLLWERMIKIYKYNTFLDDAFFTRITDRNEDFWAWSEESLKLGIVDHII